MGVHSSKSNTYIIGVPEREVREIKRICVFTGRKHWGLSGESGCAKAQWWGDREGPCEITNNLGSQKGPETVLATML